jgi:hypothetical protein
MHFGQGLWLLSWLRDRGMPARFLSVRFDATTFASTAHHTSTRGCGWRRSGVSGVPPITTGGARREIAATLREASPTA